MATKKQELVAKKMGTNLKNFSIKKISEKQKKKMQEFVKDQIFKIKNK